MPPTLSFIGCGHLGRTLGRLWQNAGVFRIQDIVTRSMGSAGAAAAYIGAGRALVDCSVLAPADVFLIATSDDAIPAACETLAASGVLQSGTTIFHCSGALPSSALAAARHCGAKLASIHPIRSFASPDEVVAHFGGTWCGTEGDESALALLEPAFAAIGARTVRIDASAKTLYHAAAVFAANYTTVLLGVAQDAYAAAGIPPDAALQLMEPLVRAAIDNVFRLGPAHALSGPAARGDMATVERQYAAVAAWRPACGDLYDQLATLASELAARRNVSDRSKE
jgi:predicted short-subunit dehydrogenase-like oxidoreductase (DUF2520 family)